jgi:glutaconate CoA-transferase subunit B
VSGATVAETMVGVLARHLRNGEWGACGAYSQIPTSAFRLARLTHAPDLWWLSGGGGALNSEAPVVASSSDEATLAGSEGVFRLEDIVDFELGGWRRMPTVGVFGGIQIDRRGNVNMVGVGGEYPRLALRGPGTVGLVFGAYFHRTMVYLHRHDPRVFVEQVDFVSSPGHGEARDRYCDGHSTGPELVVTPLAVFDFDGDGRMRLVSVHRGHTVDEVRERTGFELGPADDVGQTPEPSLAELALIREAIDPHASLAQLRLG